MQQQQIKIVFFLNVFFAKILVFFVVCVMVIDLYLDTFKSYQLHCNRSAHSFQAFLGLCISSRYWLYFG